MPEGRFFYVSIQLKPSVGPRCGWRDIPPGGVAFRLDVDAVRLRVLGFQVTVVVGKGFPQVQKSAVLFQRNGSQLIVDLAQPLFVQAGMAAGP